MTDHSNIGERTERERRRKFWGSMAFIMIVGMVIGGVAGVTGAINDVAPERMFATLPHGILVAFVAVAIVAFSYGCWLFYRAIDEVEVQDNLWGSTAGLYVYMVGFPAWWALWQGGVTAEPNDWTIFFVALVVAMAVYGWRKWRAR